MDRGTSRTERWKDVDGRDTGTLRELYPAAKIVTALAAGIVLLLTLLFFGIDLAVGKSFGAALADSLEFLSFLVWMHALMLAVLLPLMVLFTLLIEFLQSHGWTFEIEGRDLTINLALSVPLIVFTAAVSAWTGEWHSFPHLVAYVICFFGMLTWPVLIMSGLRRQQDRLLDKIRADYILATT